MSLLGNRKNAEMFYWTFIFLFFIVWILYHFYWPSAAIWRHTYELPQSAPGKLFTDFWSFRFWKEGLFGLALLAPLTGLFMIYTRQVGAVRAHWIILILLLIWFIVVLVFDGIDIARANLPPSNPSFDPGNLAHDLRYCGAYGGQPGTEFLCHTNAAAWLPGVDVNTLTLNPAFVYRFVFNLILIALLAFDLVFSLAVYQPRLTAWLKGDEKPDLEKPLVETRYQRRKR